MDTKRLRQALKFIRLDQSIFGMYPDGTPKSLTLANTRIATDIKIVFYKKDWRDPNSFRYVLTYRKKYSEHTVKTDSFHDIFDELNGL